MHKDAGLLNSKDGYARKFPNFSIHASTPFFAIVIFTQNADGGALIQQLYDPDVGGCSLGGPGFTIIGSDARLAMSYGATALLTWVLRLSPIQTQAM